MRGASLLGVRLVQGGLWHWGLGLLLLLASYKFLLLLDEVRGKDVPSTKSAEAADQSGMWKNSLLVWAFEGGQVFVFCFNGVAHPVNKGMMLLDIGLRYLGNVDP